MASGISIPNLTPAISLLGTEMVEIVQSGGSYRTTLTAIAALSGTIGLVSPTFIGMATSGSFFANASISGASSTGAYGYGSLSYADVNIFSAFSASANGYVQSILQNASNGSAASTDFIVSNNLGTSSSYYGDFGINSSAFSGVGALGAANNVYVYSAGVDLAIGTSTANSVHFVTNGSATDSATINSAGVFSFNIAAVLPTYTIATLPSSPVQGMRALCSNASVTTFMSALGLTTGGSVVPIFYNGSAWVVG